MHRSLGYLLLCLFVGAVLAVHWFDRVGPMPHATPAAMALLVVMVVVCWPAILAYILLTGGVP